VTRLTKQPIEVDVAIIGGGLAGLTLALHLRQTAPELSIMVFEKSAYPPAPAAHKVGEATVEIGAHYLAHTLGLKSLLERTQLQKFGLRLFFGGARQADLAGADELGASTLLPAISYQLDRGVLEKDLAELLRDRAVDIRYDCHVSVTAIDDAGANHELQVRDGSGEYAIACRWLVDASARSGVLKRKLSLRRRSPHKTCAAWFRLDATISVDDWSRDAAWKARCNGLSRLPSTNHLMGSGYWAWIIPLVNGRSSVGLVTDPAIHPLSTYDSFDEFRRWLQQHQPLLAESVDGASAELMDFRKLRNLSYGSRQVWSTDRWALTGESGVFTDPFYSPGTDFIGISNTFIVDLVTRDCSDAERGVRTMVYEKLYQSFYDSTMSLYEQQYAGFGDTRLMSVKLTWDYAYYWSVLAWLFFRELMTDLRFLRTAQNDIMRVRARNDLMQAAFRQRAAERRIDCGSGRFVDQISIPILLELNAALLTPQGSFEQELQSNCARLDRLAPLLLSILEAPARRASGGCDLLGDLELRLA
jgi:flavin-dependent dehydrogenase